MGLVTPDFGLVFWMSLSFLTVLFILKKFAWKPILQALSDREQTIQDSLDAAKKAKDEISQLHADNEIAQKKAHEERERILKEAKQLGDKYIADAKKQAGVEADKMIDDARTAIAAEKSAALKEIKSSVAELSVEIAEKVLRSELSDKDKQQKLIDQSLEDVNLN
jgi:F-type H+-transporting ATPase subunit b